MLFIRELTIETERVAVVRYEHVQDHFVFANGKETTVFTVSGYNFSVAVKYIWAYVCGEKFSPKAYKIYIYIDSAFYHLTAHSIVYTRLCIL